MSERISRNYQVDITGSKKKIREKYVLLYFYYRPYPIYFLVSKDYNLSASEILQNNITHQVICKYKIFLNEDYALRLSD